LVIDFHRTLAPPSCLPLCASATHGYGRAWERRAAHRKKPTFSFGRAYVVHDAVSIGRACTFSAWVWCAVIVDLHACVLHLHRGIIVVVHHSLGICLSKQAFEHKRRAERTYDLRVTRHLRARSDLLLLLMLRYYPRWYVGCVERGWYGEEWDFVIVPVDEYLARRGEDIGRPALFKVVR
jgi:hypothetical protein